MLATQYAIAKRKPSCKRCAALKKAIVKKDVKYKVVANW